MRAGEGGGGEGGGEGEGGEGSGEGGGGGEASRGPQSVQSVPRLQFENSAPAPPSSHEPSEAEEHVSEQVCALNGGGGEGEGGGGNGRGDGGCEG